MSNNDNLDVNRKNREDYEQLMQESSTKLDDYWEKDNIFVKILMVVLLIAIIIGSLIVLVPYFAG